MVWHGIALASWHSMASWHHGIAWQAPDHVGRGLMWKQEVERVLEACFGMVCGCLTYAIVITVDAPLFSTLFPACLC